MAKRIEMEDQNVVYTAKGFNLGDLNRNGKITINEAGKIKRAVVEGIPLN